jgi:hypothetical protein
VKAAFDTTLGSPAETPSKLVHEKLVPPKVKGAAWLTAAKLAQATKPQAKVFTADIKEPPVPANGPAVLASHRDVFRTVPSG